MELVEGATIWPSGWCAVPIPLDEALQIARQMAEALEAAHERGIIHRDSSSRRTSRSATTEQSRSWTSAWQRHWLVMLGIGVWPRRSDQLADGDLYRR